jgi:hypothetical protein
MKKQNGNRSRECQFFIHHSAFILFPAGRWWMSGALPEVFADGHQLNYAV